NQKVTTVPGGTSFDLVCWRDDRDPFNPAGQSRWFYAILDNGREGFYGPPRWPGTRVPPGRTATRSTGSMSRTGSSVVSGRRNGGQVRSTVRWLPHVRATTGRGTA